MLEVKHLHIQHVVVDVILEVSGLLFRLLNHHSLRRYFLLPDSPQ